MKPQIFLLLIATIPLISYFLFCSLKRFVGLVNFLQKILPILFLILLSGAIKILPQQGLQLTLLGVERGVSLAFALDKNALKFLFLLGFLWLVLTFYLQRFWEIYAPSDQQSFSLLFFLIIAFLTLIILSGNLISILFFYNCLVLLSHFFASKFLQQKGEGFFKIFTILLYLESIIFFFAIVATYKFTGRIDFAVGGILPDDIGMEKIRVLFLLYFCGIFLSLILPSYLLYIRLNPNLNAVYLIFFLSYFFSGIYILTKIFALIFGLENLEDLFAQQIFHFFEIIFLCSIALCSGFMLFSKALKASFFYLFFQQFLFVLFEIFVFLRFAWEKIYLSFLSFSLAISLVYLTTSNIILYLKQAEDKRLSGLFYNLKINVTLLCFSLFALIGVVPSLGMLDKFYLIKTVLQHKLIICAALILLNLLAIFIFAFRLLFQFFSQVEEEKSQQDCELAKNIDLDSSLVLSGATLAIGLLATPIFYYFFKL